VFFTTPGCFVLFSMPTRHSCHPESNPGPVQVGRIDRGQFGLLRLRGLCAHEWARGACGGCASMSGRRQFLAALIFCGFGAHGGVQKRGWTWHGGWSSGVLCVLQTWKQILHRFHCSVHNYVRLSKIGNERSSYYRTLVRTWVKFNSSIARGLLKCRHTFQGRNVCVDGGCMLVVVGILIVGYIPHIHE
jgi:hypothetical protein